MSHSQRPAVILMAEDDPADQELARRALEDGKISNELYIVQDGEEALDYLYRRGKYRDPSSSPTPDLFLLDLNMPKIDGRQVLEHLQKDPRMSDLTIIVLTTSNQEEDIAHSYNLGAKSFITKPVGFEQLRHIIHTVTEYWFQIVIRPPIKE